MEVPSLAWATIEWINAAFNKQLQGVDELMDGVVLYEVLCDVDANWFETAGIKADPAAATNWVLRFNNLKKIYRLLVRYYEEVMNQNTVALEPPNLNAIAKDSDVNELMKLVQLVLAIAVQSEANQEYVTVIQNLDHAHQHSLMVGIEQVMNSLQKETPAPRGVDDEIEGSNVQADANILAAKSELEKEHKELVEEFAQLRDKYDELSVEKDDLIAKLKAVEESSRSSASSKSDFLLKVEIERLKQDLDKSESKRAQAEALVEEQQVAIEELSKKAEDLEKKGEEARLLKDQLDEMRHVVEKLKKNEALADKYKKKVEECNDLRRQIKSLEEQNQSNVEKNQDMEEEFRKASGFRGHVDSFKEQVGVLEARMAEMSADKNKLEFELREAKVKIEVLEAERDRNHEQILTLEEKLRELEFSDGVTKDSLTGAIGGELHEASLADLQKNIARLERENAQLRAQKGSSDSSGADKERIALLESWLDDANKSKAKFEQDYLRVHQLNIKLENDMKRAAQGGPESQTMVLALRVKLQELEQESSALKLKLAETEALHEDSIKQLEIFKSSLDPKALAVLEKSLAPGSGATGGDGALRAELEALQQRAAAAEETSKSQLQQIHKLLMEKDDLNTKMNDLKDTVLQLEKLNSEHKATLVSLEAKDQATEGADAELKNKLKTAAAKIVALHEQNISLQKAVKKMKEHIIYLDQTINELRANPSKEVNSEAMQAVEKELKLRTAQLEASKAEAEELKSLYKREQKLISTAWYEMGLAVQRKAPSAAPRGASTISNASSTSWLGQQRMNAASQSKSRR